MRAGYTIDAFITGFIESPAGPVPRVATTASLKDRAGTVLTRIGFTRDRYRVSPGVYGVGEPGPEAPILVTANYKLSFDALRFSLDKLDAWLVVVDTRGINVWCAAGKKTFSTEEVVYSVKHARLEAITRRRTLILPQLSATGVSARDVKKGCGFKVVFGPIKAVDLPEFLENDWVADEAMRSVTFTIRERAVLIPVEIYLLLRPLVILAAAAFVLSGIGPEILSLADAWGRGLALISASLLGIFGGCVLTPLLLPWLYGRQFWIKGVWPGLVMGLIFSFSAAGSLAGLDTIALFLWIMALSSYLGMNFTGCTPYTSPTGVEREMRRGLPVQLVAGTAGFVLWMSGPFIS